MAAAAYPDDLISAAAETQESFLAVEGINRIEQFKLYIESKRAHYTAKDPTLEKKSVTYIGAICIQSYIKDTLSEYMKRQSKRNIGNDNLLRERLAYFTSQTFINRFMEKIPSRLKKTQSAADTSYANYFNCLFSVNFNDFWRGSIENYSAQRQCTGAMDLPGNPGTIISQMQGRGNMTCYLCGEKMHEGYSRMECEHLLPILSAITNWWLVKTPEVNEMVKTLYEFSHRCCNQIKSNFDFIILDKNRYRVNEKLVKDVLELIYIAGARSKPLYDCGVVVREIKKDKSKLKKKEEWLNSRWREINRRFQVFVNVLNASLDEMGEDNDRDNVELFSLLTKFKIFSAFKQEEFLKILISDRVGEPPQTNRERRIIMKEKEAAENRKLLELRAQLREKQSKSRAFRASRGRGRGGSNQTGGMTSEDLAYLEYTIRPELVVKRPGAAQRRAKHSFDVAHEPVDPRSLLIKSIEEVVPPEDPVHPEDGVVEQAINYILNNDYDGLITVETMVSVFDKIFLDEPLLYSEDSLLYDSEQEMPLSVPQIPMTNAEFFKDMLTSDDETVAHPRRLLEPTKKSSQKKE